MANETTTKFKVDVSDLKKGIQEASRQIKLANAEFKAAASGMDNWGKSADGVSKKVSQLEKVLESQKKILENYEKQLQMIAKEYGENSKEADEMRIRIANQQAVVNGTAKELKKYQEILEDLRKEEEKAADGAKDQAKAYDQLRDSAKEQQKQLDALKNEYKQVMIEQGKNSDAAKELAKEIDELSGELADNKKAMKDADKAADDLDKSLNDLDPKKTADGFTVLKGALADLAAKAISSVIDGLKNMAKAAWEAWNEFDEGRDTIIKLTGATGEMAKNLTKSYGNVSRNIVADASDIGNAIGEVNTRFHLTGNALEDLSTQYVKFAQITGEDVIPTIDDTQKALAAYGKGAEGAEGLLDALAKTSQDTGVVVSTLTSGVIKNSTAFQEMGLSLEQSVAFMGQLETSGADVETVLNGMRKALKNSAKSGLSLDEALSSLQNEIDNGSNGMDGLNAAYELFGKSGDQIYGAIKNGTLSFRDLTKATKDASGAVNNTFEQTLDATDKMALQMKKLKVTVAEFLDEFLKKHKEDIEKFFATITNAFTWIIDNGNAILTVLAAIASGIAAYVAYTTAIQIMEKGFMSLSIAQKAVTAAQWLMNAAMNASPIGVIIAAITALVAAFMVLWNTSEDFRNFWIGIWEAMKKGAVDAWDGIKKTFGAVGEWFTDTFKKAWEGVKNVFSAGGKIFDGIKEGILEGFKTVVNGIIRGINKVISVPFNAINKALDAIRGVSIAGVKPFDGLIPKFDVPQIPELKKGGVLARGQVGLLEGDGAEAVVPLERNKKWIAATAKELRKTMAREGFATGISGMQQAQQGATYNFIQNNNSPKALDRLEIYRQTRNQIELAKGVI